MSKFITLHHFQTGDRMHVKSDRISLIRAKDDRTLIVLTGDGFYVTESEEQIISLINEKEEN